MKERKSNRLKNYDYSKNGYYFITICTKNRINYFGEIQNKKMIKKNLEKLLNNNGCG
jgi:REP element-mobilizing transposase RayT